MSDFDEMPTASEPEVAQKMDRRTFLLSLSGGTFVVAAGALLAGCGGGANSGGGTSGGSPGVQTQTLNFPNVTLGNGTTGGGQSGSLVVTLPTSAQGGTATGTLTLNPAGFPFARPRLAPALPPGTYSFTGDVTRTLGGFTVSGTATYAPVSLGSSSSSSGTSSSSAAVTGPFTLSILLPTTQQGSFTGTFNGQTFSGILPPASASSSLAAGFASTPPGPVGPFDITVAPGTFTYPVPGSGQGSPELALTVPSGFYPAGTQVTLSAETLAQFLAQNASGFGTTLPLLSPFVYDIASDTGAFGGARKKAPRPAVALPPPPSLMGTATLTLFFDPNQLPTGGRPQVYFALGSNFQEPIQTLSSTADSVTVNFDYDGPGYYGVFTAPAATGFTADISGTAISATGTPGVAQTFQIGPAANVGTASQVGQTMIGTTAAGAAGTFLVHPGSLGSLPNDGSLFFSLYATTATPANPPSNTAMFSGTFRVYPSDAASTGSPADDANLVGQGTFSATVVFTPNVTGFTAAVTGSFTFDGRTYNGVTFPAAPETIQPASGTLSGTNGGPETFSVTIAAASGG